VSAGVRAPHASDAQSIAVALASDKSAGLTEKEAAGRLATGGPNTVPSAPPPSRAALLWRQLSNAMVVLLAGAAGVSLAIGELLDAAVIIAIVAANTVLGYVQEGRASDAALAVRHLLSPRALALRDGRAVDIDAAALVPGDVVLLHAGDRVPADGRIVDAARLEIDESLLTGESAPVAKRVDPPVAEEAPLAERSTMAFSGSTVTRGSGRMLVTATGPRSEVGRIAAVAEAVKPAPTPLQARLDKLAAVVLRAALVICALLTLVSVLYGEGLADSLLIGVSLAVAAVPEGLPAVVTVTLAVGMRRMADRGAIVRALRAVETLGSTTVVCTDKTGTLTENRMRVERACRSGPVRELSLDGDRDEVTLHRLLAGALLASGDAASATAADPMEAAIAAGAAGCGVDTARIGAGSTVLRVEPFDSERKRMSRVVRNAEGEVVSYVKGAPDVLLSRLADRGAAGGLEAVAERWAAEGVRVLLVGRRVGVAPGSDPESELEPLGLIGLADPPRDASRESVEEARRAGVRTVMITGDHPLTAVSIARATGIVARSEPVLTGPELDRLDDGELRARAREVAIYARVAPEHKVRIVEALKSQGEVVAMTGDGVNDVPALRAAHIGVAMGRRGSDAASAAAAMVLTDDNYGTIVAAIKRGRVIYEDIQRFVTFLLSANAGEVIAFTLAVALGLPAPVTVLQILMVNLLTDGLPAMALGLDPPAADVMRRPPRPPRQGLLDPIRSRLAVGGLAMGLAAFAAFLIGNASGEDLGRTMAFTTLVFAQLTYVFAVRGDDWFFRAGRNRFLHAAVVLSAAIQVAVLAVEPLAERFDVVHMSGAELAVALGLALVPFAAAEALKAWRRKGRGIADQVAGRSGPDS
jgi:Ca2+-transporting ATPase